MKINKRQIFLLVACWLLMGIISAVPAPAKDTFPSKPINLIVPLAPGGALDAVARAVAIYMGKYLKTNVIISNVVGAGGAIAYTKMYRATPDGYTLMIWNTLPPFLEEYKREVGYKTLEFTPLAGLSRDSVIIAGHTEGSKNFTDFVKQAKAQTVSIGTTGKYSATGLQGALMTAELGLKINWVTFESGGESLTTLAGKHIDTVMTQTASAMPLTKAGKIVPLLIFADKRAPKYPTVPTPGELGYNMPILANYTGIVGPPGMDKEKIKILENAILQAARHPDYLAWMEEVSPAVSVLMSAAAYQQEIVRLAKVAEKYKYFLK